MKRKEKLSIVQELLDAGNGNFTAAELLAKAGTARRARSALFLSRKDGIVLEPLRDGTRAVVSYHQQNRVLPTAVTKVAEPVAA